MTMIGKLDVASEGIPHVYCLITASRSDACTIRRPRNGIDRIGMTTVGEQCVSGDYIPHSYDVIPGARDDTRSIRRPCQGINSKAMIAIDKTRLLPTNIPDVDGCVIP